MRASRGSSPTGRSGAIQVGADRRAVRPPAASLTYAEGERDMIVLRHEFGVVTASGRRETRTSTLVAFGEPGGDSAMARTVSLPAAVAARLILDGRIASTGVRIPVEPEIYEPVLDALEPMGIVFRDTRSAP